MELLNANLTWKTISDANTVLNERNLKIMNGSRKNMKYLSCSINSKKHSLVDFIMLNPRKKNRCSSIFIDNVTILFYFYRKMVDAPGRILYKFLVALLLVEQF
jgi:hypothetical protein